MPWPLPTDPASCSSFASLTFPFWGILNYTPHSSPPWPFAQASMLLDWNGLLCFCMWEHSFLFHVSAKTHLCWWYWFCTEVCADFLLKKIGTSFLMSLLNSLYIMSICYYTYVITFILLMLLHLPCKCLFRYTVMHIGFLNSFSIHFFIYTVFTK